MNSYTTNKNQVIHFEDVDFISISTVQSELRGRRVMVDRAVVVQKTSKDIEIFGKDVELFNEAFAKYQFSQLAAAK